MSFHEMKDDELLRRYLLGQLGEEQAGDLERRLLEDDTLFELAEAVEGDLLAAAARGALPAAERGRVLRHLAATPQGRARYELARGLATLTREERAAAATVVEFPLFRMLSRPGLRAAAVAATLVIAVGALKLATVVVDPGTPLPQYRIGQTEAIPAQPEAPPPIPPAAGPTEPRVAEAPPLPAVTPEPAPAEERPALRDLVFQLALTSVRSSGAFPRLTIPPGSSQVEIRLPLAEGEAATELSVLLLNAVTGEEIRKDESLAARPSNGGRDVVLSVPAADLPEGLYEIEVRSVAPEEDLLGKPRFEVHRP